MLNNCNVMLNKNIILKKPFSHLIIQRKNRENYEFEKKLMDIKREGN